MQIARSYGGASQDPAVVVLDLPTGQTVNSPQAQAKLRAVDRGIATAAPSLRLVSYASTGSRTLVGTGGTSTIVLAYPPKPSDDMDTDQINALTRAATAAAPGLTVHGTSLRALEAGNTTGGGNPSVTGELIIGAIGALVVLAWVFGSLLALCTDDATARLRADVSDAVVLADPPGRAVHRGAAGPGPVDRLLAAGGHPLA
ncbi:hypothetical protein ACFY0F_29125 [Streptomyces sp. NPDC001544]|uniref:hypothetical protein n=1 Tax=Streptomyces sp. NPDC001544 TaxID=3364584 RepID=UPI0036BFD479